MDLPSRRFRPLMVLLAALALLAAAPPGAEANWLTRILRHADDGAPRRAGKGVAGNFDDAGAHLKALPPARRGRAIAAEATDEGHWRLRNADGETFTAATPDELKRGFQLLVPMKTGEVAGHVIVMTTETIARHQARLKELPPGAELNVLFDEQVLGLVRRMVAGSEKYYLDVGGGVHVPITTREQVHEMLWQLARPIDPATIRMLALEPGATALLKSTPPPSAGPGRMAVETVDPERLPHMLGAVARGTIVVTGRLAGLVLHYRPSSGPERTVALDGLRKAAAASDVNLVIVSSASARQPGTRNWLWQRVDVTRLEPSQKPALGSLVRQLTGGVPVEAQLQELQERRAALTFSALAGGSGGRGWIAPVGDTWRDLAPEVTGTIVATGLQLDLRSRVHQKELNDRIVPGIPSGIQWAYICFLLLGLIGLSAAGPWWQRIWPLEERGEYSGRAGYWAARVLRGTLYIFVFLPLVSPASAPVAAVRWLWGWVAAISRFLTAPFGRRAA
jgi:hypothetical protein